MALALVFSMSLRREPFRVFFPVGLLIAVAGVVPWLLFAHGRVHAWPGPMHGMLMTQGFLAALAVGFLGTLLPRRTGAPPLSALELALAGLGLAGLTGGLLVGELALAQAAFLLVLALLVRYGASAFRRRAAAPRPAPPSFVLLPLGLATGAAGATLLLVWAGAKTPWAFALGRELVQQGFMLLLVMALAPMLAPILLSGAVADPPPARAARLRLLHLAAGLALLASFAVELWWSEPAGLVARAVVLAASLWGLAGALRPRERKGLHRLWLQVALVATPLGLLAAGIAPAARASFLHLTFVGGLGLLALAITVHVTVMHTGREALAERSPALVGLAGALMLGAAAVRAQAERFGAAYIEVLLWAAVAWIAAVVAWGLFVVPKLRPGAR